MRRRKENRKPIHGVSDSAKLLQINGEAKIWNRRREIPAPSL